MFIAVLTAFVLLATPVDATPAELLAGRDGLHQHAVVSRGTVGDYRARTSKAGNKYTTFTITLDGAKVGVYHRGHAEPPLQNGDKARVTGIFQKERTVGDFTVKDQIDASAVQGMPFGAAKE